MFADKKIILASQSPRRKQLLEEAGISFSVLINPTNESYPASLPVEKIPEYIAYQKASAVKPLCDNDAIILAADTLVIIDDQVIGKPADEQDAIRILQKLSGRMHRVITGVALLCGDSCKQFSDITEVYFKKLSVEEIQYYVSNFQPYDKAGAYAIQEWIGLIGVEKINGSYFNVMGLPVSKVIEMLPPARQWRRVRRINPRP